MSYPWEEIPERDWERSSRRLTTAVVVLLYGWAAFCSALYLLASVGSWWWLTCCAVGPCVTYYGATLLGLGDRARGLPVSLFGWAMVVTPTAALLL